MPHHSALLIAFAICFASTAAQYFSDNATTPYYGSSECRIRNSRICDPDDVLQNKTYELAQLISSIETLGKGCGAGPGYKVGLAVVRSVPWSNSPISAVEQIARRVHAKWQIGTCGDAIIIASAADQNVVYVVAESQAGASFLNSVKSILGSAGPYFAQSHRIGLQYVLIQIKSVLNNYRMVAAPYPLSPAASGPRSGASTSAVASCTAGTLLMAITASIFRLF